MLSTIKKFLSSPNEVSIITRGRGRYILFHSYKIFESGKIETSTGKVYEPIIEDGKAYLTLKFGKDILGEVKLEIARIVYSYFVEQIDIVNDNPKIIYLDNNGTNFRLDNLSIKFEETSNDIEEIALSETTDEEIDSINQIVDEINSNNSDKENESEYIEILDDDNLDIDDEELQEKIQEVIEDEFNNQIALAESEERKMEETTVQPEENLMADMSFEKINEINSAAMELVKADFASAQKEKIKLFSKALKESETIRDREKVLYINSLTQKEKELSNKIEEIKALTDLLEKSKIENQKLLEVNKTLNDERTKINNECYLIKKEQFQKMYVTFNKVISMANDLRD